MERDIRKPDGSFNGKSIYVAGIDVAHRGLDETAIVVLEQLPFDDNIFIVHMETAHTPDLNMVIKRVMYLNQVFNFRKVIIDETGIGAGISDLLKNKMKGIAEGIWFTQKSKAEIFYNLKLLMTKVKGRLFIPDYSTTTNPIVKKLYYQLLSIQQEFTERSDVPKIFHEERSHDDLVCALALAASYWKVGNTRKKYPFLGLN
jgi:hypothetical protein